MLFKLKSVWGEQLGWAFKAERFAGSKVRIPGDLVEFILRKAAEVGALSQVLPQEAVGIFVGASLPLPRSSTAGAQSPATRPCAWLTSLAQARNSG